MLNLVFIVLDKFNVSVFWGSKKKKEYKGLIWVIFVNPVGYCVECIATATPSQWYC